MKSYDLIIDIISMDLIYELFSIILWLDGDRMQGNFVARDTCEFELGLAAGCRLVDIIIYK